MRKHIYPLLAATLLGTSLNAQAALASYANVSVSPFSYSLFDLDPTDGITPELTWTYQTDSVSAGDYDGSTSVSLWQSDWTTPIHVTSGSAYASADSSLAAQTSEDGYASVERHGSFSLTANTLVLFRADASMTGGSATSFQAVAQLWVSSGYWTEVPVYQHQSGYSTISLNQTGTASGVLGTSFANLAADSTTASFSLYAYANAAPVPEPETYAMFLAGLGLMGAIARRRRSR